MLLTWRNRVVGLRILVLSCAVTTACTVLGSRRCAAEIGIWTSAAELASVPMSGPAWQAVLDGANQDCSHPDPSNQDDNTNVDVLAASIVYARTGDPVYRQKVVDACEMIAAAGRPAGRTLPWAREIGAYALAADLANYRTPAFESWLRQVAEVYRGDDLVTLRVMFERKPNNWGSHAFGTLCAIYRYLGDDAALVAIRSYWQRGIVGPNPGYKFGDDLSWQVDPADPRLINPLVSAADSINMQGLIPEEMRRGGPFHIAPVTTQYPWEFMQGQIMAARILARANMPIWNTGDFALLRATVALQYYLATTFEPGWMAQGDDEWMLPFLDDVYGMGWSGSQPRLWKAGKNVGWGYVTLAPKRLHLTVVGSGSLSIDPPGQQFQRGQNVTLEVKPWPGGSFLGWLGDLEGPSPRATIKMSQDRFVTALFTPGPIGLPPKNQDRQQPGLGDDDHLRAVLARLQPVKRWTSRPRLGEVAVLRTASLQLEAQPNPFNPTTVLRYSLAKAARVRISVHDVRGRRVGQPVNEVESAGQHARTWEARDLRGRSLPSGTYFARLQVDGATRILKLIVAR